MLLNLHRTRPDQNNTIFILIKIQLTNEKMFFVCSFVWVSGFAVLLTRSFDHLPFFRFQFHSKSLRFYLKFVVVFVVDIVIHLMCKCICLWMSKELLHGILYFQYVHLSFTHPENEKKHRDQRLSRLDSFKKKNAGFFLKWYANTFPFETIWITLYK